jgi:hypothetical protein
VHWVDRAQLKLRSKFLRQHRTTPCFYRSFSFDLDYPLEVDDDYWEHEDPKESFKQPQGKPSLITAFNLLLKLCQLQAFALRTIVRLPT